MNYDFFLDYFEKFSYEKAEEILKKTTQREVEDALNRAGRCSPQDFLALLSPAADDYLEEMAQISQSLTRKHFGHAISIFAPLYLSNECSNVCTYCGFSRQNKMERITLDKNQIEQEIFAIKKKGIEQILLLTGEDTHKAGMDYFEMVVPLFRQHFREVNMEVQPLSTQDYRTLRNLGVDGIFLYQETYHKKNYRLYHPKGKKSHFTHRLLAPFRAGESGMHKIGLGVLLGLENWRIDSFFCVLHLHYLQKKFWKTQFSISFPRLRPATGVQLTTEMKKKFPNEIDLAKLIFAYRLFDEHLLLSLSTRENQKFRDHIAPLGITSISAESKTSPGGYECFSQKEEQLEQFATSDNRSIDEIIQALKKNKLEPVFYDWMSELS